MPVTCKLR